MARRSRTKPVFSILFRAAAFVAALLVLSATADAETRVALVIGNGAYRNVVELANPPNDAHDVGDALKAMGFQTQIVIDADLAGMRNAVATFAKAAAKADVSLFYYGGHGLRVSQKNLLVPVDASFRTVADVQTNTYPFDELMQALSAAKGQKLVFLDACRNNPIKDFVLPQQGQGLAEVGESEDFFIAYATKPEFIAYDGDGRNSPFAQALVSHLATPGADISNLMIEVRREVVAATGGEQVPWDASSLTKPFFFVAGKGMETTPEGLLWQAAAREHDRDLLAVYLDRYPKGPHAEDARALAAQTHAAPQSTRSATEVENDLWQLALSSRQRPLVELYLARYPSGRHHDDADALLKSLKAAETSDKDPGVICARLATVPADAAANATGADFATLKTHAAQAVEACRAAADKRPDVAHYKALLARALFAAGAFDESVALYRKAADAGDGRAMASLALLMETGDHTPKDVKGAMELYGKAADLGIADGAINLGYALFEGKVIDRDVARAFALFKKASEAGSARATYDLATLVEAGVGGKPEDALGLFRLAASQGEPSAHRAAAVLLDEGRKATQDPAQAAKELLACVGADNGDCMRELASRSQDWSPATLKAIQTTLKAANYYDGSINGRGGPELTAALKQWRLLGPPGA